MTRLADARRLVVKIGSALLVDDARGDLRRSWLEALADDVARCAKRGQEVLLVS
ncbi:MAG TPA: glutamate 5-kinase, partial [Stellaceae bacterium]|nr:glutamate 5-kinase [Stellaceae bacterium]